MTRTMTFLFALLLAAPVSAQRPEERGPVPISSWDAGAVPAAGTTLLTRVYFPTTPGSYPLVGVIHGANSTRDYHPELASTLASWGMVVVVPNMPCGVTSCDHDANQRQISALLEWAVAQSGTPGSMIAGLVDGSRRGLIGHSWGGLSSHLTSARDPSIDSVVLLDPNDDAGVGLAATSTITAPVLQLIAETEGACNNAWREAMVRAQLSSPNLDVQINGSGHCNPGEMDVFCSFACGSGADSTTPIFRRYAVAWTACNLLGDARWAEWVGGASYDADVSAAILEESMPVRLDELPCRAGGLPDGGVVVGDDAGVVVGTDAGVDPGMDAGELPGVDAGPTTGVDSGPTTTPPPGNDGGCGCHAGSRGRGGIGLALLGLALAARRRRG